MIRIAGSARRSYLFPAPLDVAFRFIAELDAMLGLLPHIEVVASAGPQRRLCYHATEAGLYQVRIYCTVMTEVDPHSHRIRVRPTDDPAPDHAGFRSMSGHGRYESTVRFHDAKDATRIDYALKLKAALPTPGSLRLLPESLVNARAGHRFRQRMDEILDGFVVRSIAAYEAATTTPAAGSATARGSRGRRA